jgi:hypothetical protein
VERLRNPVLSAVVAYVLVAASMHIPSTFAQSTTSGPTVTVSGTGGSGLNFRATPGGSIIRTFPLGTRMIVVGNDQQAEGRTWRNVRSPDGVVGWMAADYLSGTANAPEPTTQADYRPGSAATGSSLQVVKTGGMNAILRDNPGGTQVGSYPEGSSMSLVSSTPRETGGREWKNVRGPDGKTGWMASFLLSGEGSATVANPSSGLLSSRSPFTLTSDMRSRALAARARAVPLLATGNSTTDSSKQTSANKQNDSKATPTLTPTSRPSPSSSPSSSSSSSSASKKP